MTQLPKTVDYSVMSMKQNVFNTFRKLNSDIDMSVSCGVVESYPRYVEPLVQQCMEWCDSYTLPLVVPLTVCLPDPRPALVTSVAVGSDIVQLCPTTSAQHVFCADSSQHSITMYHVPSGRYIRTFPGKLSI